MGDYRRVGGVPTAFALPWSFGGRAVNRTRPDKFADRQVVYYCEVSRYPRAADFTVGGPALPFISPAEGYISTHQI